MASAGMSATQLGSKAVTLTGYGLSVNAVQKQNGCPSSIRYRVCSLPSALLRKIFTRPDRMM